MQTYINNLAEISCLPSGINCCSIITPSDKTSNGRRLYIHEYSFEQLALHTLSTAKLIYSALAPIVIVKSTRHHLVEDGVHLGIFALSEVLPLFEYITNKWSGMITSVLKQVGHRATYSGDIEGFYPLLMEDESIVATCYDVHYYTFATNEAAAVRMYQDTANMQVVKKMVRERTGYDDLTIVKGRVLALINHSVGTGPNSAKLYSGNFKATTPISVESLDKVKYEIAEEVMQEFKASITAYIVHPTQDQEMLLQKLFDACSYSINKGILKLSKTGETMYLR